MILSLLAQSGGAVPRSAWELVRQSSTETIVVLVITGLFSLASWFLIGLKWWQFRRQRRQGDRFFRELERTTTLTDAYHAVMKLPPSPYHRIFREAVHFVAELRPGALKERADLPKGSLTPTQLEALKMILAKDIGAERDAAARYIPWLATIGSVSPLLGLLGTVLGVMSAFIGIAAGGSGNLAAVAPGVAEALVTTVAGLAAAIPAVMAYNYFAARLGVFEGEMEGFANELIGTMAREGLL
ncbi:MAG TPA: MotA/TolQ/ExbB proton channel family protein [Gemmatimonadales bacterium]|nr:MotA/TolQ/ExbB proton channel family protein [Gemmatimonadales bacterium]